MSYRRANGRNNLMLLMLGSNLVREVNRLPVKPAVSLCLIAVQCLIHFGLDGSSPLGSVRDICLHPRAMLRYMELGEWVRRLVMSTVVHGNDLHLYYNMVSLLHKGATLEPVLGSQNFGLLVAVLAVLSGVINVALSYVAAAQFGYFKFLNSCGVGFSGVLFGLSTVIYFKYSDRPVQLFGISVPPKYVAWIELVLIQVLQPNVSFLGHLSGILAGLICVLVMNNQTARRNNGRPQFYGSGRLGTTRT